MEAKKRTRRHLSAQAWAEVFGRFAGSGESVTGFCRREGLHTSSFQRWRRRLAASPAPAIESAAAGEVPHLASPAGFIEMDSMTGAGAAAAAGLEVRLDLGGGIVLHVVRR